MDQSKRQDWPVFLVHSHEEMDAIDDAFYEGLTNQERLDIMVELVARHQHGTASRLARVHRLVQLKRR